MSTSSQSLIAAVVEQEHVAQLRNSTELDQRAGFLLAISGALIAVVGEAGSGLRIASLLLFSSGALAGLVSILIRPAFSLDPNTLRARYSDASREEIQLRVLDMRCDQYLMAATKLTFKSFWFLLGAVLVTIGTLCLMANILVTAPAGTP